MDNDPTRSSECKNEDQENAMVAPCPTPLSPTAIIPSSTKEGCSSETIGTEESTILQNAGNFATVPTAAAEEAAAAAVAPKTKNVVEQGGGEEESVQNVTTDTVEGEIQEDKVFVDRDKEGGRNDVGYGQEVAENGGIRARPEIVEDSVDTQGTPSGRNSGPSNGTGSKGCAGCVVT